MTKMGLKVTGATGEAKLKVNLFLHGWLNEQKLMQSSRKEPPIPPHDPLEITIFLVFETHSSSFQSLPWGEYLEI